MRLGLGKQQQDDVYTNAENVQRRRLETEIQGDEDEERKGRREARHMHQNNEMYWTTCPLVRCRITAVAHCRCPLSLPFALISFHIGCG